MTLIFRTDAGTPVLVGDMLISVSGPYRHKEPRLPFYPDGIRRDSNLITVSTPSDMRRKLFIVNEHLAVGAAGAVSDICMFIQAISAEFRDRSAFARSDVNDFLKSYVSDRQVRETSEQIGALILMGADSPLLFPGSNYRRITSNLLGKVTAIGAGTDRLTIHIEQLDANYNFDVPISDDNAMLFPEFIPLMNNFFLLARLYWNEYVSPDNLFEGWGGAYDLVYQDRYKRFQYIPNYTIFFRMFDGKQPQYGLRLTQVLKYERRTDFSYIATYDENLGFCGARDITSASRENLRIPLNGNLFNSDIHISIIGVGTEGQFRFCMVSVTGLGPQEESGHAISTQVDSEGKLHVTTNLQIDAQLQDQAMSRYRHYAANRL